LYIAVGVLAIVLLGGVGFVVVARLTSKSIDAISCDFAGSVSYHVHAHLTIVVKGRLLYPPGGVGIHYEHLCLYWLHTHDASGVIHIEAPHRIEPTLKNFFDIWGQPLSRHIVWRYRVPAQGSMRVFVGHHTYMADPGSITLFNHTVVTIEVGPPFIPPPAPNFEGL
jgi:hypothetical protein